MATSREADRREAILVRQGQGQFFLGAAGHEALAALAPHLQPQDHLFPHYRDRALLLACGLPLEAMAAEFLGRETAVSRGRNMPQHYGSRAHRVFSIASPVGSQCLPAVGAAWRAQRVGDGSVVLCALGDGSTRQGEFYEAVCFARQMALPILFLVEDNGYAISTPTGEATPLSLGVFARDLVEVIDGCDPAAVSEVGGRLVARARAGGGPGLLWARVERLVAHSSLDDQRQYRDSAELGRAEACDPLARLVDDLLAAGELTAAEWDEMRAEIEESLRELYDGLLAAARPPAASVRAELVAPPPPPEAAPVPATEVPVTYVEAVNRSFAAALAEVPETIFFGEDIADPRGGVFGLTQGLSTQYPDRVINAPLAEATIIGAGVGLAATGLRPVFELQFIDFIGPGLNQLISQAVTLRWRSHGDWACPLVLYAPYGGYIAGGIWHSQSNDGWWTHLPGLQVVIPSCPEDVPGLFWTALRQPDPTLLLLPKRQFGVRAKLPEPTAIPFGQAALRRRGGDVSLVGWGNAVEVSLAAAGRLASEGIEAEVLDLRTLAPCDWAAIADSVARTGRLVVVQEDCRTASFGSHILAEMTGTEERLALHLAAPQLVSRADLPVPFSAALEQAVLPQADEVAAVVRKMVE